MTHVERTFTVDQPGDKVFAYLSDFTHTNEWDPGTVQTTRVSGDGGLGTTYANRSTFMGREVELTYETVVYEPNTAFSCRGHNKSATATDILRFSPDGDGTRIVYRAEFEFHGLLKYVAPLVVRGKLDSLADETVEQLRTALSRL